MATIKIKRRKADQKTEDRELPNLRKADHGKVIALLCSDLHLSLKAPIARSAEPNWLAAQARPLNQLQILQSRHKCPIVCAGDVFDKWNASAELINWSLDHLPRMFTIAGNHDLPNHSLADIEKSAYWTLHAASAISDIATLKIAKSKNNLFIYGFPCGTSPEPLDNPQQGVLHLAVVHTYCYGPKGSSYPGAPESCEAGRLAKKLRGFDVVSVGDNHQSFYWYPDEDQTNDLPMICNNGGLQCRTIAEVGHKPRVNLLHEDGHVEPHFLDCSEDKFIDVSEACNVIEKAMDMTEFIDDLRNLGEQGLDFAQAVKRFIRDNNIDRGTVKRILEALEK